MVGTQANDSNERQKTSRALKTISEAADLVDVPQHVLRFWETKFPQIKPLKRNGGRRFYRPDDIETLLQIKFLLYKQGYTIKGAKKLFEQRNNHEILAELQAAEDQKHRQVSNDNAQIALSDAPEEPTPHVAASFSPSTQEVKEAAALLRALSRELRGE